MNRWLFTASSAFLLLVALSNSRLRDAGAASGSGGAPAKESASGARIRKAAGELFESLNEGERQKALHDYSSKERFNWHFIPRERKGVALKDLDPGKRAGVAALLSAALSERGARQAEEVMALEGILREIEGPKRAFPRDPLLYLVTFFGKPSSEGRWGFRFEGHHLSLNFALDGERVLSITPAFYGANPAIVREGPRKGHRLLAGLEDRARELVASLPEDGRKACVGEEVPQEVPGPETSRYQGPFPAGLAAEKLEPDARKKLFELIREYTSTFPDELVKGLAGEDLKEVRFAWRGGLKPFEPHSYLIHGTSFVINYTNIQNGAAHVHSCLRVLKGEFGLEDRGD